MPEVFFSNLVIYYPRAFFFNFLPLLEFAKNGPGFKTVADYRHISAVDMIDENIMAVVYGGPWLTLPFEGAWTLTILKYKDDFESAFTDVTSEDNYAYDMVVCRGQRRLGVLITDNDAFAHIKMYDVSEDGKTLTEKSVINLLDSALTKQNVLALTYNSLSFYGDVSGFLMNIQGDKVELWAIENICSTGEYANIRRILNMENWNYAVQASAHLGGNFFAVALQSSNYRNEIKVVEILGSDSNYDDHISTVGWSGEMFCTDLSKDDTDTLVALGAEYWEMHGRLVAFRWSSEDRKLVFAGDLMTEDYMLDAGSERGPLSVYGQKAYFGETADIDNGRVFEYQFRYD